MADISSITLPGGGTYNLKDKNAVPKYGMGKNLLDNAYFVGGGSQLGDGVFPINQRGQTSYGQGNSIDRWIFNAYTYGTLTLTADGITILKNNSSYAPGIQQNIKRDLDGKVVTFSLMDSNKNVTMLTSAPLDKTISGWQFNRAYGNFWFGVRYQNSLWNLSVTSNNITIAALKLEEGTESTISLALPDYLAELYKCQWYLKPIRGIFVATTAWNDGSVILLPSELYRTMRSVPTRADIISGGWQLVNPSNTSDTKSLSIDNSGSEPVFKISATWPTRTPVVCFSTNANATMLLSAEI